MDDRRRLVRRHTRASRDVSIRDSHLYHLIKGFSKIAVHCAQGYLSEKAILIDAFAGAGGNTIAFALSGRWKRVYAIENNPKMLACAKHNAEIYGVQDRISWYEGNCFEIITKELADCGQFGVVFASPPWGGEYVER